MKEYPILFSAPMVQALLAARKTQTRRVSERWLKVKAGDRLWVRETWKTLSPITLEYRADGKRSYMPGFAGNGETELVIPSDAPKIMMRSCWRPSICMPRWASRITLEATEDARREPLRDISEADAIAEGIWGKVMLAVGPYPEGMAYYWGSAKTGDLGGGFDHARQAFHCLWDSINGKTAPVSSNPVPVRLAFRLVQS